MPGTKFALGIDFGTESGRVMLVRADNGEEVAWSLVPYPHGVIDRALPDGTPLKADSALQDPRDYLVVLDQGVPEALRKSGVSPADVIGVGIDFTACTMLPALAGGAPLCTLPQYTANPHSWVKLWKHHAAQPQANRINELGARRGEEFLTIYGGKYSSEWFFSKLLETLEEAPEIYAAAERFLEGADWIVWQMTGRESRNECTAGYKGMWIKGRGFPSRDFFRALDPRLENVVAEKLSSAFLPLGAKAGGLTEAMAARMGLVPGAPVAAGNVDAHAGVPACGVTEPGRLAMIMGTSICHMLLGRERQIVEGMCGVVEDGIVPGYWGYEAGQSAVGDIYAWFFRVFDADPTAVTGKAARLQPGESGLLSLDWWNGNRSILVDADLSGVILGLTLATRPEEIYRALVESTAFGTRVIIDAFEQKGIPTRDIVACGGLAEKSPLVMQIFADVTGRQIRLPRSLQASGLGAAMHGAVAAGYYKDIAEAAGHMAGLQDRCYQPDPAAHAVYNQLYQEYRTLHDYFGRGANPVLKRLRAIRHK
ncbi:MAG: ribulokinase [Acidobacteria bacterium]|nr:ribulokinase [Acidobacteriota bacterium]